MRPVLLLACAALAAAAVPTTDIRLQLGSYPGLRSVGYEADDGSTSPDYAITDRSGAGIEGLASHAFASFGTAAPYIQAGLAVRGFTGTDEAGWKHSVDTVGILIGGGVCWQLPSSLTIELGPALTLGTAVAHEEAGGASTDSDHGSYASLDLRGGAWWTQGRFQLGGVVGVATESATAHQPDHPGFAGAAVDATYRGRGGFGLIGAGIRL